MKKYILGALIISMLGISSLFAQGFQPPAENKAVIYFVRVSSLGFAIYFDFFHQDKYIGSLNGKNYLRYESSPGEQLFWASSENKVFMTANLKAGATYIVIVDVIMGVVVARVGFTPVTIDNKDLFERAKKMVNKKEPVIATEEDIKELNKELEDFISEKLKKYNEKWKYDEKIDHISEEMAIPADALK